jgi:hypothetical protein
MHDNKPLRRPQVYSHESRLGWTLKSPTTTRRRITTMASTPEPLCIVAGDAKVGLAITFGCKQRVSEVVSDGGGCVDDAKVRSCNFLKPGNREMRTYVQCKG